MFQIGGSESWKPRLHETDLSGSGVAPKDDSPDPSHMRLYLIVDLSKRSSEAIEISVLKRWIESPEHQRMLFREMSGLQNNSNAGQNDEDETDGFVVAA